MAKRKGNPDQEPMFPDLDMSNPEHKKLLKAAKAFYSAKAKRAEVLGTMKEDQDSKEEAMIAIMLQLKMPKFEHGDMSAELIDKGKSVTIKLKSEDGGGEEPEAEAA